MLNKKGLFNSLSEPKKETNSECYRFMKDGDWWYFDTLEEARISAIQQKIKHSDIKRMVETN